MANESALNELRELVKNSEELYGCGNCIYKNERVCQAPSWYSRICGFSTMSLAVGTYVPEECPDWLHDVNERLRKVD